jgi:hypothetical protein
LRVKVDSPAPVIDLVSVVAFREGEHMGEAPFLKSNQGLMSGELREIAEVYDSVSDSWVSIAAFIFQR